MIRYFDAHNHLHDPLLAPHRAGVMEELARVGLVRAVVNGTTEADWEAVSELARQYPWVLPSYGLHPWFLARRTPRWRELLIRRLDAGACGIGEIGLDRWMPGLDFEDQKNVFIEQLNLATERNRPVSIHCLKAWGPLFDILRAHPLPARGFLLHSYGGSLEMVRRLVELGASFSFSGYPLHERKGGQREVFKQIPIERLLVETDAPSMSLPASRAAFALPDAPNGQPVNHPANIAAVYEGLAEIRGMAVEDLAARVEENFTRLFPGVL